MNKKILIITMLLCSVWINITAQQTATVKKFELTTDHISSKDRRNDFNGKPCALIKVQVLDEIERVEGNKIGKIVNKGVEKWIYMCRGSRNMKIHLKNHLPVTVKFNDYKINGLESNRVYVMTIEGEKPSETLVDFTLRFSPSNATVLIDNKKFPAENGTIMIQLPTGQHSYIVTADSYEPSEGAVILKEGQSSRLQIDLVKIGAAPESQDTPNENQSPITTPNMVRVGSNGDLLTLTVFPFNAKIIIDEKEYEADGEGEVTVPLTYGNHKVKVSADGYEDSESSININKSVEKRVKLSKIKNETGNGTLRVNNNNEIEIGKSGNLLELKVNLVEGTTITVDDISWTYSGKEKIKALEYVLSYGNHSIKAECVGYEPISISVNIGKSKVSKSLKLKKLPKKEQKNADNTTASEDGVLIGQNGSQIVLNIKPAKAVVVCDENVYNSNGKWVKNLSYGVHQLSIEAPGYLPLQTTVNVGKSKITRNINLQKIRK